MEQHLDVRRVGLVSADLTESGLCRLAASAAASLAAGAGCVVVALEPPGPLSPTATAMLLGVHLLAASRGAEVTFVTSDSQLRRALLGLPVPGGARVAASAPVALRAAAGVLAPTTPRVL